MTINEVCIFASSDDTKVYETTLSFSNLDTRAYIIIEKKTVI